MYNIFMGNLSTETTVVRPSLSEQVYHRLVDAILAGKLASGEALNVADIAGDLKVSPSPVRDAIARLVAEGLAMNNPNRRTTVTRFAEREAREIMQVREILECGAVRLAAEKIDATGIAKLRDTAARCAALYGQPARKKEMLDLDNQLHLQIAEASGNPTLVAEIVRCKRRVIVMQWMKMTPSVMGKAYAGHLNLISALARHDADGAEASMRAHIQEALDFVLQGLQAIKP
jgi:DNA-binding GntR family transcriptional regulator